MAGPPKPSAAKRKAPRGVIVGTRAPDFTLSCTAWPDFETYQVSLDDYRDRWLVLLFYPRDFSMVCPTELTALGMQIDEFTRRECDLLGVSTDPVASHQKWIATPRSQGGLGGLAFPLASDEDGAVCQAYGVLLPTQHVALRGLFIIDPNGVLQYQVVHNLSIGRRSDEVLRVLEGLQTGGLCPEGWSRDQPTLDPTRVLGPDRIVGQYRIEAEVGSGTFGVVYRARDLTLERTVALKVFRPGPAGAAPKLLDEARTAAALNHPNVCTIHSVDESDGISMIVMEYVDGRPLKDLLASGKLPLADAKSIGRQIAQGMAAAHAQGIVHGDLKPANIMVGADRIAKIMDFGLAHRQRAGRAADETASWGTDAPSALSGTPAYMSPEQARGEPAGTAGDVFSLGLVLYEMAAGRQAIPGDNLFDVLRAIDALEAEPYAAQLPEPLSGVVRRALVSDWRKRAITMHEIAQSLATHDQPIATT
jgi:alkyl hydroperoxide reductase subunit AhpC/predicted Ser/Thr protein kinase